jgi:hypothetical protein
VLIGLSAAAEGAIYFHNGIAHRRDRDDEQGTRAAQQYNNVGVR